jgi:hypothetical protein
MPEEGIEPTPESPRTTYYIGYLKGVGRIYKQKAMDTYTSVAFGKLYTAKVPVTAAD